MTHLSLSTGVCRTCLQSQYMFTAGVQQQSAVNTVGTVEAVVLVLQAWTSMLS